MHMVRTSRFGEVRYDPGRVITFARGILGFEGTSRYILLNCKACDQFKWLQSIEDPALAFLLYDPSPDFPDYWPPVNSKDLEELDLRGLQSAIVMCIATVPGDPSSATANFQAPLVINVASRLGKQVVTGLPSYKTKQAIFHAALEMKTG
ncbi:MAG: flagellar assembly protein FliW [Bacillota bacterium]|nr:flagellar assembly protein FliW [Bacillota bacterium]